jgi:hypothetical protein
VTRREENLVSDISVPMPEVSGAVVVVIFNKEEILCECLDAQSTPTGRQRQHGYNHVKSLGYNLLFALS